MNPFELKKLDVSPIENREFVGVVIDNKDPELHHRLKVKIPGVTEGLSREDTPWFSISCPPGDYANTMTSIPPLGSRVTVYFDSDDIYSGKVISNFSQRA